MYLCKILPFINWKIKLLTLSVNLNTFSLSLITLITEASHETRIVENIG